MATLFDSASLAMIPSGVKDGKLYSIKPTDGSGDFTFSRGTDTATRVAASGLIEKERSNLLLQSNQFDTTWSNVNTTETAGQSDKDGGTDAWLLSKSAASARIEQSVSQSGVQTFSLYAKAGTLNWVRLNVDAAWAFYDLSNGVVGSDINNILDHNIYDIGSGWYRCELVVNLSATIARIYPAQNDGDVSGTSGNIVIQDAQLEQSLVATSPVIETTTAAVYEGITDNLPRLDYSGGASCPSLKLEPSRTNIQTNSEYVNAYVKSHSTITTNATTSPEGVSNASKVIPLSTATGWAGVNAPNYSFTSGDTYTLSVFAKAGEYNYCQVGGSTPAFSGSFATINLTNGVVEHQSGITATTEDYGNGWYRILFTHTAISTASSPIGFFAVYSTAVSSRLVTQVGDNTSGVYIFGWQCEAGNYKTSYIPTYGASASRAQDACSKTGITSLIGQTEGTLFAQVGDFPQEYNGRIFAITQNSSNYITLLKNQNYNDFYALCVVGGSAQMNYQGTGSLSNNAKIAIAYANNDFVIYVNGTQVHSDTSASVPTCSNVYIGQRENGTPTYSTGGSIKQALLFKTRLTNSELAALTTL